MNQRNQMIMYLRTNIEILKKMINNKYLDEKNKKRFESLKNEYTEKLKQLLKEERIDDTN